MTDSGLVSIIIPCFNQGHFLPFAIESALAQTYPEIELIVVNDGSTDDTSAVARSYGTKVTLVEQPNTGLSAARNAGMAAAKGSFFVLLDADDVLLPRCVEFRMQHMKADVGIVAGYYREIDQHGRLLPRIPEVRRVSSLPHLYQTVKRNWGPSVAWTIRRRAVEVCGPFDPFLPSREDHDFAIRVSSRYKIAYDSRVGYLYRRYPKSMSQNHLVMYDAVRTVLKKNSAYADHRLAYWWWSQFGHFQHKRRIIYNMLASGSLTSRLSSLVAFAVRRPMVLWYGWLSFLSLLAGKRPSAKPHEGIPSVPDMTTGAITTGGDTSARRDARASTAELEGVT